MQLEKIIDEAIIELKTGKPVNIDVSVRVSMASVTNVYNIYICYR